MKHRTTPALLVVVALLLALNLAAQLPWPMAQAQEPPGTVPILESPARIIGIAGESTRLDEQRFLWRLWSDGTIEENSRSAVKGPWQGWQVVPNE